MIGPLPALARHAAPLVSAAALALPVLVIVSRSAAEAVLGLLAAAMLVRLALGRAAEAWRAPWFLAACAYWAWLVLATLLAGASLERLAVALAWIRFPLALLAVCSWALGPEAMRRHALWVSGGASLFVALETWAQFLLGRGLTGTGRALPGYLSGPFARPRVGAYLGMLMWPALFAGVSALMRQGLAGAAGAAAVCAFAFGAVLLSGQRVMAISVLLLLLAGALLLPALRRPVLAAVAAGALLAAAAPLFAPDAFARYAEQFPRLIAGFGDSHYGQILARTLAIAEASPWIGHGAEAFRHLCRDPRFFVGWGGAGDGGGAEICVPHPHNHYLEALADGGMTGLLLFGLFQGLLALALLRGLLAGGRDPVLVGLALPVLLSVWPLQTSAAFAGIESAGPRTFIAGWALAAAAEALRRRAGPTSSA
ncbi:MAG: O-antigen ligase family protein [Acetobacteraceae bacterium]|nr:O-antigen ligase family protein [Acetobacteraceae bacterium]MDW8397009.1 O-antigen ligase family protein [Acetobacteraceae bacterium]